MLPQTVKTYNVIKCCEETTHQIKELKAYALLTATIL